MTRDAIEHGLTVELVGGGHHAGSTGHVVSQLPSGDIVVDVGWCECITGPDSVRPVFQDRHGDGRDTMQAIAADVTPAPAPEPLTRPRPWPRSALWLLGASIVSLYAAVGCAVAALV